MRKTWSALGLVGAMSLAAMGQVTNVQMGATNSISVDWKAMPGNPYCLYATPNLVQTAWSNLTPEGLVFVDAQGFRILPTDEDRMFYCAMASDYLVVDLSEGPTATNYPVGYTNAAPQGGWTDEYKTTKLVLRRIPGGTFKMGSPANEVGHWTSEVLHQVSLTKDFYIGVFEVTQKQWERVAGTWPSYFTNASCRDSRPVEQVSYNNIRGSNAGAGWPTNDNVDADSFMGRLRTRTGLSFDLPTESQWEHACRAGTISALNSGYELTNTSSDARMSEVGRYWSNGPDRFGMEPSVDTSGGTAKVGSYLPNAWGLHDTHGNVYEWCLDWYGTYPGTVSDPKGAASGVYRMLRSGGWNGDARFCRSANRAGNPSSMVVNSYGFRTAMCLP